MVREALKLGEAEEPEAHFGTKRAVYDRSLSRLAEGYLRSIQLGRASIGDEHRRRMGTMPEPFYFLCYSSLGLATAIKLADQLTAGPPSIAVWLDKRKIQPGIDWDLQIAEALSTCTGVLYLMSEDSVSDTSECQQEWKRALTYKRPIVPLLFEKSATLPYRLAPRQYIDFTGSFEVGLAKLRDHLRWRGTDEGKLHALKERLEDAKRDLKRASEGEATRILEEIGDLNQQIERQQAIIANPEAAKRRTDENISRGIEREKAPAEPVAPKVTTKFINRLPMIPPLYFQNRHVETGLIGEFLKDESQRLMTVVGRGGVGKTAMVCRLLKALEAGTLPDDGGDLSVDGIVYLSARIGRPLNYPNLFADLCRLLPDTTAKMLDQIYRDGKLGVEAQMQTLLAELPRGCTVVLLDNFEDVVDAATQAITEGGLNEALCAAIEGPPHGVKFVLTTRVAPQALLHLQPAVQQVLELDEGLASPYAENVLKAMDKDGSLGLREATAPLNEARIATRGYPRALEAVVGILRADRSTTLAEVLVDLQALHVTAEHVVRDLVGEAFSRLDPLAQEVMQALAIYGVPVPAVAVDYLLRPYKVGIDTSKVLSRLVNMQFARGEARRFYLHPVDRDYALSRLPEGELDDRNAAPPPFTRHALRHYAAEYFKETRRPREEWKSLNDLLPQLTEFDLRIAGDDYDAAASVLLEIDGQYLDLWGHSRLLAERYERLDGTLIDAELERSCVVELGNALYRLGQYDRALDRYQRFLELGQAAQDRWAQAEALNGLGLCFADLGDDNKAIEFYQQALSIQREREYKQGIASATGNLANSYASLGRMTEATALDEETLSVSKEIGDRPEICRSTLNLAIHLSNNGETSLPRSIAAEALKLSRDIGYRLVEAVATALLADLLIRDGRFAEAIAKDEEACAIADEIGDGKYRMEIRYCLAWALLYHGDLRRARAVAEEAGRYCYPPRYPEILALRGIVALRQGNRAAARDELTAAVAEAEKLLSRPAKPHAAAYTKALAYAGLALCPNPISISVAVEAYRDARAICSAPGVVQDALCALDALAVADAVGILKPVRAAAAGET